MGKLTGAKIKEARTAAKLTQEKLAQQLGSVTAADISKAERGEKELSQAVLKAIAKATGVTQASLLNAEKGEEKKEPKTAAKTPKSTAKKETSMKLSAAEIKLVELYRAASADSRSDAIRILKGEKSEVEQLVSTMLGGSLNLDSIAKLLKKK